MPGEEERLENSSNETSNLNQDASSTFDPNQPSNSIAILKGPLNANVYLVGTAHFSIESQKEVINLIKSVRPKCVVLELCNSRKNILKLDEETVLREAKEMDVTKMVQLMKKTSVVQGLLQSLLIRIYAKVTKELGFAPGGEFRVAYNEALKIPGCRVILGDMPVDLTLSRGFSSLPWFRKLKLAWMLFTTDTKLTQEDIEQLKKSDMIDTLLQEFGSNFPEFKRVLIDERDMYLTNSLRMASQPIPNNNVPGGFVPSDVVGVVGLGHLNGIKNNWEKQFNIDYLFTNKKVKSNYGNGKYAKYLKFGILLGTTFVVTLQYFKKK